MAVTFALTLETLAQGVAFLCARDPHLARIYQQFGLPPLWAREPGFATLTHIILEQQVSLASAKAAFMRLQEACEGSVTPEALLRFDDLELKQIGFSRQKAAYARLLAHSLLDGSFSLERISMLEDADAYDALLRIKGVGPWTANIYLLMALLRPDAWPPGDLALEVAWQKITGLEKRPSKEEMSAIAGRWQPWRAVAARLLWHDYLSRKLP